ncbi:MAG: guanosine-5'-triphosphate,3'-diphosphate pyrophosphatase, partial [Alteromonadales bacterium]|nr:guanosine-5'-triphosphate,3'-diphosphate pyrophosphatase [Alteromonadales bacterium]
VQSRYQLDAQYGELVAESALQLLSQCGGANWIVEPHANYLLASVAKLHEIGLAIDYKKGGEHSAYLLQHLDLPGYTRAQKHLLAELARRYREQISSLPEQHALSGQSAKRVLRLLRITVLLTHRRCRNLQPRITLTAQGDTLELSVDQQWLDRNPLTKAELELEANRQSDLGWPLILKTN